MTDGILIVLERLGRALGKLENEIALRDAVIADRDRRIEDLERELEQVRSRKRGKAPDV